MSDSDSDASSVEEGESEEESEEESDASSEEKETDDETKEAARVVSTSHSIIQDIGARMQMLASRTHSVLMMSAVAAAASAGATGSDEGVASRANGEKSLRGT
jgi:hypothetical protein